MTGFDKPNYTQVPNALFDLMPLMGTAELKVVMTAVRQTFGYHRESDAISLTQFEKATGLSRQGVIDGIAAAIERGVMLETGTGKRGVKRYRLLVKPVDQSSELTSTSQASRPELVKPVDTQKKERKVKEKTSAPAIANAGTATQSSAKPAPQRERNPLFDAVAKEIFDLADNEIEKASGGRIGPIAAWLAGKSDGPRNRKVGYISRAAEPEHVRAFCRDWKANNNNATVPRDIVKFVESWRAFASRQQRKARIIENAFLSEEELNAIRPTGTEYLVTYAH